MKLSLYNTVIPIQNKHTLVYNALSGKFLIIKNKFLDINSDAISSLNSLNNVLYQNLIDAGVLIDDNIDEIKILNNRIINSENNDKDYILHINPTLDCNLRCWYCYEKHITGSKMSRTVLSAIKKFITREINANSKLETFHLGFFGGEPLLYYKETVLPLISHASKTCKDNNIKFSLHFTSNGTILNSDIIELLSQYNCGFQITIDGDKKYHNNTRFFIGGADSFDLIINNIIELAKKNISVIVRINYTAQNIKSIYNLIEYFNTLHKDILSFVQFDFQRVWQDRINRFDETEIEASNIRNLFRKNGLCVLTNYIPKDIRFPCYGDKKNHVLINYNGLVFGCTARDFTIENSIGRLHSNGYIIYNKEVIYKRNTSKFSKDVCKTCRIAPLCGGGCKQRAYEALDTEECTFKYTPSDMDNMVLDLFEYCHLSNP